MKVLILTEGQKNMIQKRKFGPSSYFHPVQDCDGNWIISTIERDNCVEQNYMWVKNLPEIDWCSPDIPPITGQT